MSARDELLAVVVEAEEKYGEPGCWPASAMLTDQILAAGWRPPARVIETHSELASMVDGTVIRDGNDRLAEKRDWPLDLAVRYFDGTQATNEEIPLPVSVLWESGDPR